VVDLPSSSHNELGILRHQDVRQDSVLKNSLLNPEASLSIDADWSCLRLKARTETVMREPVVKIEYQLSESEYLTATRLLFFQSREAIVRMGVICVLALMSAFVMNLIVADMSMLLVLIVVVIIFDVFLFYNALVTLPRQYFRGDSKFREKYEVTFSSEGVFVKTIQIDSKLAWSLYTKAIEGREMYLMMYGKDTRMMTAVPKRAFKSRDEEIQFRELVTRHIADHSGLKNVPPGEREYTPRSLTPPDWR